MDEKHQVYQNPMFHPQIQPGENEYEGNSNNTTKPMDITPEDTPDTARPASPVFEEYESTTTGSGPARSSSVKRKPASTDVSLRPKRPRHDNEVQEAASAIQAATPAKQTRPIQSMTRTTSTPHKSHHSAKLRPRAQSLPARLSTTSSRQHLEILTYSQIADNQSQHIPPVNLKTLRELELSEFYRNPKLRHDVVFDSQLHFRPNNDGSRGARKKVDSHGYWQLVLVECEILLNVAKRRGSNGRQERPVKIPILLATMRDILLTLVPRADREEVESSLDPDLLMQQLEHGILDLKRMSLWLAQIFKAHCAPMRDQWVDLMVSQFARGVDRGDTKSLMEGWKSIFGILEAMKLDVANHQIRTLRPHLVSTAVVFEQSYFQSRIEQGKLNTHHAKSWYQDFFRKYQETVGGEDHIDCFMRATLDMITPSRGSEFPATFQFDNERLDCLREDIREATCLKLCTFLFRQLAMGAKRDVDEQDVCRVMETISAVLGEEGGSHKFTHRSDDVALSIAHMACGSFPSAAVIKVAENWLAKHLQMDSPIYKATELTIMKEIVSATQNTVRAWLSTAAFPISQVADCPSNAVTIKSIAQRLANIAYLHWQVFGKLVYLSDGSSQIYGQKMEGYGINLAAAIGTKEIIWSGDRFTSSL